jgi:hypothetical protein
LPNFNALNPDGILKKLLLFVVITTAILACTPPDNGREQVRAIAMEFFDYYKSREDWQGFLDLYAEDMVFEEVVFRYTYDKQEFAAFYNWPDTLLKKHPDYPEVLVLEDLAVTDSTAMGRGYFTPFYYAGELYEDFEHMRFVITLHFNKEGKISRQTDFIEYPPEFLQGLPERLMTDSAGTN